MEVVELRLLHIKAHASLAAVRSSVHIVYNQALSELNYIDQGSATHLSDSDEELLLLPLLLDLFSESLFSFFS